MLEGERLAVQPIPYTGDTVAQSVSGYRQQMYDALRLCQRLVASEIPSGDFVAMQRAQTLQSQLMRPDHTKESCREALIRGTLLEVVSQELFHDIAQSTGQNSPYAVIFAPPALFDASKGRNKGGDLLLIKQTGEDSYEAIALIDVTTCEKSERDLRSATHEGLGQDDILPVIIAQMGDMEWLSAFGSRVCTRRFLQSTARKLFRANVREYPLWGAHPDAVTAIQGQARRCIEVGCDRSRKRIISTRRNPQRQGLIENIDIVDEVLGNN